MEMWKRPIGGSKDQRTIKKMQKKAKEEINELMPRAISIFTVGFEALCCFPGSIDGYRNNARVTNKEICLVEIVFIHVYGAVLFVRSATD